MVGLNVKGEAMSRGAGDNEHGGLDTRHTAGTGSRYRVGMLAEPIGNPWTSLRLSLTR